jgi:hypothetical protein
MATQDDPFFVQDGTAAIATAMWVGTAALMVLGIQPIFLAALVAEHRITDMVLGRLATVEVLAIAVGSAIGTAFFRTGGMRSWRWSTSPPATPTRRPPCWPCGSPPALSRASFWGAPSSS